MREAPGQVRSKNSVGRQVLVDKYGRAIQRLYQRAILGMLCGRV